MQHQWLGMPDITTYERGIAQSASSCMDYPMMLKDSGVILYFAMYTSCFSQISPATSLLESNRPTSKRLKSCTLMFNAYSCTAEALRAHFNAARTRIQAWKCTSYEIHFVFTGANWKLMKLQKRRLPRKRQTPRASCRDALSRATLNKKESIIFRTRTWMC